VGATTHEDRVAIVDVVGLAVVAREEEREGLGHADALDHAVDHRLVERLREGLEVAVDRVEEQRDVRPAAHVVEPDVDRVRVVLARSREEPVAKQRVARAARW
jgi:hypothetical protein